MDDRSIAWMIGGGSRAIRPEDAVQAMHRRALREAQATRHAGSGSRADLRGALTSLFRRADASRTAPTLDCCAA